MSALHVDRAWRQALLTPTAKLMLLALAAAASGEGLARLTMTELGRRCNVDRRTVQRRLPELVRAGCVAVIRGVHGGEVRVFEVFPGRAN